MSLDSEMIREEAAGADQTEQTRSKLRDSERNFRLLVQSVTDYAIYMLEPDGTVASWNAGAERIKGYKASEIVGKNFAEFFTPRDRDAGIPAVALKVAGDQGRYESEGRRVRKDGSQFWALAVIDAVRDESGTLLGFAKITRDMTERREAELRLAQAQEQLAQSQKMEAIGHLTGGVAHDFNNLLMIVKGQAQLMRMRAKDPKDLRALAAIEQATANGSNLTRQLLSFARRQRLNCVSVDLKERLDLFRDLLVSSVGGSVKLQIEVDPVTWQVEVDVGELELALVNIAVNARDAMPGGGTLKITSSNVHFDGTGIMALSGDFVALSLADTGCGMSAGTLSKVFEPFFTTKEVGKGTGLGLSQVYGFTRQSGGDVQITSEEGSGTTITLFLPRSTSTAQAAKQETPVQPSASEKGTILVVEDNLAVGEVSSMLLEQFGYTVKIVASAAAALELLEHDSDVDLVFSDILMPGDMDGLGLAQAVRKRFPHLPILLATGYSSAAERAGRDFPIIRKPYDHETLGFAVKAALAGIGPRSAG